MMGMRLGARMERAELAWTGALIAGLAAGMVVTVVGMMTVVGESGCDADFSLPGCNGLAPSFGPWENAAQSLILLLWVIPLGLGTLLGVGVTARELEQRTAQISWSLSPTRIRWLLLRSAPVALFLVIAMSVAAGFAELAERGRLLTDNPGFYDYQLRNMIVPARALLAFTIGLAAGAVLGRSLPALLVGLVFAIALTVGINLLLDTWHVMSATWVPADQQATEPSRSYALPAGSRSAINGPDGPAFLMIPASEFWTWVLRETAVFLVAAIAIWVFVAGTVERRSP